MKRILIVFILIFFVYITKAQTYTQACVADTRLNRNDVCTNWQTTNYGTSPALQASTWTYNGISCGQGDIRGLLKFDVNPPTNSHALYDNRATLNLFFTTGSTETHWYTGSGTDNQFYVQRVTANWLENTVTWNTQPSITTTGQILVPSSTTNPSTEDYQIDISTLVYDWVCGTTTNYGLRLILVHEGQTYRRVTFATKEFATTSKHPTLTMEYAYIAATAPDTICEGDAFTVNCALNNANNPGNYNYQWIHTNSGTNYTTQNIINPLTSLGLNTYIVTVSNPWCQTAKDTVTVFVEPQPIADAGNDTAICSGQSVPLTATGGSAYSWSNGGSTASINVTPSTTTTYVVTVSNGSCTATDDVVVTVTPQPIANAGNDVVICSGQSVQLTATGGSSYSWSNGGSTASINVTPPTTTTYTVTVSNGNCSATDDVIVTVNPVPTATFTVNSPICEDEFANVTYTGNATPGATYSWYFSGANLVSGTNQGPYVLQWTTPGTQWISLQVTENGCSSPTIYDSVIVYDTPEVLFKADTTEGCAPVTINFTNLSVPSGDIWQWDFGDGGSSTQENPSHTYTSNGNYSVTLAVSTNEGCDDTLTWNNYIHIYPQPIANFTMDPNQAKPGLPVNFTSSTVGDTWLWEFGDGNTSTDPNYTTHTYVAPNNYTVVLYVSNIYGCSDSLSQDLLCLDLEFPNIITPNGDGKNDYFVITGADLIYSDGNPTNLCIYNRWGKKVFETENYNNDWDGDNLADGVYYYIFEYLEGETYTGSLTILGNNSY